MADDEVVGLAMDWSKCYRRVPFDNTEANARVALIHFAVWRPMLAAYRLPRCMKANVLAGPAQVPVQGLAPGYPAATSTIEAQAKGSRCRNTYNITNANMIVLDFDRSRDYTTTRTDASTGSESQPRRSLAAAFVAGAIFGDLS